MNNPKLPGKGKKGGRHTTKKQSAEAGELKDEECSDLNEGRKATDIRKLPSSMQTSTNLATPEKNFSSLARAITKPSLSAGDNFQPANRVLIFSARPISEIATIGSRASSISSITTSPSNKVGTLNRVIVEQSNLSQGEETEVLKFLRKLKEVEEERE